MTNKMVGVIGGMGPAATVDLMRRVLAATPANDDIDHVRMIVDNNPQVPSRIKALIDKTGESPGPCMADMGKRLQNYGVDFLVIPCNTAHHYYRNVVDAVRVPVLNMIKLTADRVCRENPTLCKVGILASTAVLDIGLYHGFFDAQNVATLFPQPEEQAALMQLIKKVKAGQQDAQVIAGFNAAAENLKRQGATCLIIACTELSVLANKLDSDLTIYDASQVLAEEIVKNSRH
ncbi:MAG: aspartate/glutamate racemase family protein [Oceanospirillaceae bacterium]|nr:aspartate/glutamate racemase family protein [Oceanospirillaceae bacterium]